MAGLGKNSNHGHGHGHDHGHDHGHGSGSHLKHSTDNQRPLVVGVPILLHQAAPCPYCRCAIVPIIIEDTSWFGLMMCLLCSFFVPFGCLFGWLFLGMYASRVYVCPVCGGNLGLRSIESTR